LKALVVAPYYQPKIGGLENFARQIAIALHDRKGWEIVIVASNHERHAETVGMVDGMKIYRLSPWFKFSNTPVNPLWPLHLKSIIRKEKPDIIPCTLTGTDASRCRSVSSWTYAIIPYLPRCDPLQARRPPV